jgi:DNA-binding NarL/FixJ family response regulator
MKNVTLLIADDHPLLVKGLSDFLSSQGFEVLACETNGIKTFHQIVKLKPQIAILDVEMPDMTGTQIMEKVSSLQLPTRVIFNTIHRDQSLVKKAYESGVKGFLLKEYEMEEIVICIEEVMKGRHYYGRLSIDGLNGETSPESALTPSEIKILRYIGREYSTREIADKLFIAEKTVEKHRSNIIRKLGLPPRKNSLLVWALSNVDLLSPGESSE